MPGNPHPWTIFDEDGVTNSLQNNLNRQRASTTLHCDRPGADRDPRRDGAPCCGPEKTTGPVVRKLMPSSARGLWCYSRLREPGRSTSRSSRQLELPGQAGMARLRRSSKRSNLPEAGAEPHRSLCSHKRTGRRPSASCRSNDGHTKGMSGWRSVASRHPLHERRLKTAPNAGEQHKNRRDDQERQ